MRAPIARRATHVPPRRLSTNKQPATRHAPASQPADCPDASRTFAGAVYSTQNIKQSRHFTQKLWRCSGIYRPRGLQRQSVRFVGGFRSWLRTVPGMQMHDAVCLEAHTELSVLTADLTASNIFPIE